MQNRNESIYKSLNEYLNDLNSNSYLFKFDPDIFLDDDPEMQKICGFVLALCLIFNDIKDLMQWHMEVIGLDDKKELINPKYGTLAGLKLHIIRLYFGVLDEFLELIKNNEHLLETGFMKGLLKQLSKENRDYWEDLINLSKDAPKINKLRDIVWTIRNKVAFHYACKDLGQLVKGYKSFFKENIQKRSDKFYKYAYVSRGNSMKYSRYYFADAMIDGFIELLTQKDTGQYSKEKFYSAEEHADKLKGLFEAINSCLRDIINQFFQKRDWKGQSVLPEL